MALGERIKTLRKEHGWPQADLAARIGADAGQISRYEGGKITPSVDRLTDLDHPTDTDRDALLHILDGLLPNTRIRAVLNNAS